MGHTKAAKKCLKVVLIAVMAAIYLTGCGGQPLSRQEIVRAVFFGREGVQKQVLFVIEDQQNSDETAVYKTARGKGETFAQAMQKAEASLEGRASYGLMEFAGFPAEVEFEEAGELAELLNEKVQPAPEIFVAAVPDLQFEALAEQAGELYETMMADDSVRCGLQELSANPDCAALPQWQETGWGFLLLPKEGIPLRLNNGAEAALASVLCGQCFSVDFSFGNGKEALKAGAYKTVFQDTVYLHLTKPELTSLTGEWNEVQAREALKQSWRQTFTNLAAVPGDPMRLDFWAACRNGSGATCTDPGFEILFE